MSDESSLSFAAERSKIYWLLSRFYLEQPDRSFIEELQEWTGPRQTSHAEQPITEFDELSRALAELQSSNDLLDLQKEYTRLFAGLKKNQALPPPYESIFRDGNLAGDITVDVNHHYWQAGYGDIYPEAGPQDHLGVELRYMSLLCYDEHAALEQRDIIKENALRSQQWVFLEHHLTKWAPDYCAMLEQESRMPFYSAIASLTAFSLKTDTGMLARIMAA